MPVANTHVPSTAARLRQATWLFPDRVLFLCTSLQGVALLTKVNKTKTRGLLRVKKEIGTWHASKDMVTETLEVERMSRRYAQWIPKFGLASSSFLYVDLRSTERLNRNCNQRRSSNRVQIPDLPTCNGNSNFIFLFYVLYPFWTWAIMDLNFLVEERFDPFPSRFIPFLLFIDQNTESLLTVSLIALSPENVIFYSTAFLIICPRHLNYLHLNVSKVSF